MFVERPPRKHQNRMLNSLDVFWVLLVLEGIGFLHHTLLKKCSRTVQLISDEEQDLQESFSIVL